MSVARFAAAAAALALVALPAQAGAGPGDPVGVTVTLRAFVPVLCRVQLHEAVGAVDEEGVAHLGTADEFCNAPQGYRVLVQHPADLQGAAIIRNGERIPLSPGGETVLTDSSHANVDTLVLAVDVGDDVTRFNRIGVRIEAKG